MHNLLEVLIERGEVAQPALLAHLIAGDFFYDKKCLLLRIAEIYSSEADEENKAAPFVTMLTHPSYRGLAIQHLKEMEVTPAFLQRIDYSATSRIPKEKRRAFVEWIQSLEKLPPQERTSEWRKNIEEMMT